MPHTVLGITSASQLRTLSLDERLRHIAVFGISGSGKSSPLSNIVAQDIARGDGVLLLDPHGRLAEDVLPLIPKQRADHLCHLDLTDRDFHIGWNILSDVQPDDHSLVAEAVVSASRGVWGDVSWGPELQRVLRIQGSP
jgi:Helicase HerA, central domain